MPLSPQCPKCSGAMSEGYIVDKTHGGAGVSTWAEGAPRKSVWTGLKLSGVPQAQIETWRCRRCGFLEQYASAEPGGSAQGPTQKQVQYVVLVAAIVAAIVAAVAGALLAR